jgi:hypothetical protein
MTSPSPAALDEWSPRMTLALASSPAPTLAPETVQQVLLGGDLAKLTPTERVSFYNAVCSSVGLNPLTQPFAYLRLNGKEVLYARKDATEQLRFIHQVSIDPRSFTREVIEGVYIVTATASFPSGRTDVSTGAVPIQGLTGENRANAMMKAETKAKRRVTLSLCGLGMLDETEIETIPGAARVPMPAPTVPPLARSTPQAALVAEGNPGTPEALAAEALPLLTTELPEPAPAPRRRAQATGLRMPKAPATPAPTGLATRMTAVVVVLATAFINSTPPHHEISVTETSETPFEPPTTHLLLCVDQERAERAIAGEGTGEVFLATWHSVKRPDGSIGKILDDLQVVPVEGD